MEERNINFGLDLKKHLEDSKRETNYVLGAVDKEILEPSGQWTEFMPECEIQKGDYADWMDCVTESAINAISILLQRKFNILVDRSQRFTAKMSGTTHNGNSLFGVSDSLRHDGSVEEKDWPRDRTMSWNEYYAYIPASVKLKGGKFAGQFEVNYEKVPTSKSALKEALKYGPVQVIGYAWASDNGLYYDYGYQPNHAFLLTGYAEGQYWIIYDSYPTDFIIDENSDKQEFIKHLDWNYSFGDALLYSIKLKPESQSWLYKLMAKLRKIIRDAHGAFWFIKPVDKEGVKYTGKQKIESVPAILGWLAEEFGIERNNVSDEEMNNYLPHKFFG
jgi:hypothetical protein